jgi:uncharacterized protein YdbL (DUF1318 family)
MSMLKKFTTWFVAIFAAATLMTAWAADPVVDQAKAMGVIGEKYDGYIGVVDQSRVTPDLQRRVDQINNGRLAQYKEIADKTGVALADVGIGMGEKLFVRAGSGEMLKPGPSDPWMEKP